MTKARLFDYHDSKLYYKKHGIDPDKHFDKLCEKYGTHVAVDIVDRNMIKIWSDNIKKAKQADMFERVSEAECPFPT